MILLYHTKKFVEVSVFVRISVKNNLQKFPKLQIYICCLHNRICFIGKQVKKMKLFKLKVLDLEQKKIRVHIIYKTHANLQY